MRVATGEASTITLVSASWRMASWSLNDYVAGIKKNLTAPGTYPIRRPLAAGSCNALSDM